MSTAYTVQRGDNLSLIAKRYGLRSWQEIYNDAENAEFRRKRPNPNLIFPGDVVIVPGGPSPLPAPPRSQLENDLEGWLVANKQGDVVKYIIQRTELVMLAEMHVGRPKKAAFLADIVAALGRQATSRTHFHASEHYIDEPATQVAVQNYVWADNGGGLTRARRRLPQLVREYEPVLDAARLYAGHRYAIVCAGSHESNEEARHAAIHGAFNHSIQRHNSLHGLNQITRLGKGNFLIGEFHATRKHTHGKATPTTSMSLIKDGWKLHVVRLTVNAPAGFIPPLTIVGGESLSLEPLGGGAAVELFDALNRVAGGKPFVADIRGDKSPFSTVRIEGGADIPYHEMVDVILHLP
jgi:LysM domain